MANGKIIFGKQAGGKLALIIPDGIDNTEVLFPESGDLATKEYIDNTTVKLTENQTVAGIKTFSSDIVGNITGNANYATSAGSATSASTSTTQATSDNSTKIATTAFVKSVVGGSGGYTQSLSSNGWTKLPNGLIMQWGTATINYNKTDTSVTFPIAFPNGALHAQTSVLGNAVDSGVGSANPHNLTRTGMSIHGDYSASAYKNQGAYWFAIGY